MKLDTTINPREIAYYERLAETWWDTKGPFWPLHRLNELRIIYIRDQLCRHFGLNAKADKPLSGLHDLLPAGPARLISARRCRVAWIPRLRNNCVTA